VQLIVGLALYGFGCGLMVEAGVGLDPWTVFAQGVSLHTGIGIGWVTNLIGFGVLLLWIPLRQKPGVGTIANILLVGTSIQVTVTLMPALDDLVTRIAVFAAGLVSVAVASGLYIGAHFGPGPRDGLMTGIRSRFGWPIWLARAVVELTVLAAGWLLGGNVGVGTVAFAVLIGPMVHVTLPLLDTRRRWRTRSESEVPAATVQAADAPGVATNGGGAAPAQ
jgi:uncharacterized membrane protein YczE